MKYILYEDFRTGVRRIGYLYTEMAATTDFEAIEEAEKVYNPDMHYLIRIMKKSGKVEKDQDGWKKQKYTAVMCKRSNEVGWHANTDKHSERQHDIYRFYTKDISYIE